MVLYYQLGGGPMFDMGPYYLTALVSLLGPVSRVTGSARISFPQRVGARAVGNPVREAIAALPAPAPVERGRPLRLLVIGGSLGAQALNQQVPAAVASGVPSFVSAVSDGESVLVG